MTEPSNAMIADRLERLTKDFHEHKKQTNSEIDKLEMKVEKTAEIASSTNLTMSFVKTSVDKMEQMMNSFISIQGKQSDKIDEFINSDSRRASKNNLVVSILQVGAGILAALLGFWAKGQM